jgi:glycosyltransferase involved in cell wall biosynthesis
VRLAIVNHHGGTPAGAEFSVLLFVQHLPHDIEPVFFVLQEGAFADQLRSLGGEVVVLPMSARIADVTRARLRFDATLESLAMAWRLAGRLRAAGADVVLTNSMKAHVIGSLAARFAGIPCVNFVHDIPDGIARFVLRVVSGRLGHSRLACSETAAKSLGLPDTTVIYTPLETERYRELPEKAVARATLGVPNDGRPLVALVGRIVPLKGQDRFVRIAALVRERLDARFAIVGSPVLGGTSDYLGELKALVLRHGLQDVFHFVPWLDDPRDAYAALDVGCNCSTREGLGRTTLEAMAARRAVVCFDDGGIAALFAPTDGVTAVPAGREDLFADAIAAVCANRDGLRDSGERAASAVQRLDVRRLSIPFENVLRRAAAAA